MDFERLSRKYILSRAIARSIFSGIVILIFLGVFLIFLRDTPAAVPFLIGSAALLLLLVLFTFLLPQIGYRRWRYRITADRVEIRRGVLFQNYTIIPMSRVQHVTMTAGPVDQRLKVSSVEIYTAGGQHTIPALDAPVAEQISGYLKEQVNRKLAARTESEG